MDTLSVEREIEKYKAKISNIKRLLNTEISKYENHIAGLQDALRLLGIAQPELRIGNQMAKIRDIIREEGKPLHIAEITEKLKQSGRIKRSSLAGSLNFYVKAHRVFTKTAPNTYGLKEKRG